MLFRSVRCIAFCKGEVLAWPTHMTQYVAPKCTLYCSLQGKVFAGPTNMTKYVVPKGTLYCFLQGKVFAWPTHMTHYVVPECTLYCFLQGKVLAGPTNMTRDVAPKCSLYSFMQGVFGGGLIVPGWPPVAWGWGCLLIGSSDRPFPKGEEGGWKKGRWRELNHSRPKGLVGFWLPREPEWPSGPSSVNALSGLPKRLFYLCGKPPTLRVPSRDGTPSAALLCIGGCRARFTYGLPWVVASGSSIWLNLQGILASGAQN